MQLLGDLDVSVHQDLPPQIRNILIHPDTQARLEGPLAERSNLKAVLYGKGAQWKRVFSDGVVPQPFSETGIMGTLTAGSLVNVLSALGPRDGDVFLDVGCGHGAVLGAVHLLFPGVKIHGVDSDSKLVDHTIQNLSRLSASYKVTVSNVAFMNDIGSSSLVFAFCEGDHHLTPPDIAFLT